MRNPWKVTSFIFAAVLAASVGHNLIDNASEVREEWLAGRRVVGISSGASAPENLVDDLVEYFRARGVSDISEVDVIREDVRFMLPKEIREELATRAAG